MSGGNQIQNPVCRVLYSNVEVHNLSVSLIPQTSGERLIRGVSPPSRGTPARKLLVRQLRAANVKGRECSLWGALEFFVLGAHRCWVSDCYHVPPQAPTWDGWSCAVPLIWPHPLRRGGLASCSHRPAQEQSLNGAMTSRCKKACITACVWLAVWGRDFDMLNQCFLWS